MFTSVVRVAASVAVILPTLADAQAPGQFTTLPPPPDAQRLLGYQPGQQAAAAPVCPKLCPGDNSPCDPLYMKESDGRCDGISASLNY